MEQAKDQGPQNPADRPLVTFDANIVYALRNNESDILPVRQLLTLNRAGVITINAAQHEKLRALLKRWERTWRNAKNDALGLYNHLEQATSTGSLAVKSRGHKLLQQLNGLHEERKS